MPSFNFLLSPCLIAMGALNDEILGLGDVSSLVTDFTNRDFALFLLSESNFISTSTPAKPDVSSSSTNLYATNGIPIPTMVVSL